MEASSLAAIELPEATYDLLPGLPSNILKKKMLSALQLEGVLYAYVYFTQSHSSQQYIYLYLLFNLYSCQRHTQRLQTGERKGFFENVQ